MLNNVNVPAARYQFRTTHRTLLFNASIEEKQYTIQARRSQTEMLATSLLIRHKHIKRAAMQPLTVAFISAFGHCAVPGPCHLPPPPVAEAGLHRMPSTVVQRRGRVRSGK